MNAFGEWAFGKETLTIFLRKFEVSKVLLLCVLNFILLKELCSIPFT